MSRGRRGRQGTNFKARVKSVLLRTAETKMKDLATENVQLYHNLGAQVLGFPPTTVTSINTFFNPWATITTGTLRSERIGDKITPRGMSIKFWYANKGDRPNCMFRVILASLPKEYAGQVVGNAFNPFQTGPIGNSMVLHPDNDVGVKFLYDKIYRPSGASSGVTPNEKEQTKAFKIWIKPKKAGKITYMQNLAAITSNPLALFVLPYEQYSTATTSNVASVTVWMRMYYKDI